MAQLVTRIPDDLAVRIDRLVEDGTFDRSQFSHLVNLYEMNSKYATVVTRAEALAHVESMRAVPRLRAAQR